VKENATDVELVLALDTKKARKCDMVAIGNGRFGSSTVGRTPIDLNYARQIKMRRIINSDGILLEGKRDFAPLALVLDKRQNPRGPPKKRIRIPPIC
jgi:hypothetical protein